MKINPGAKGLTVDKIFGFLNLDISNVLFVKVLKIGSKCGDYSRVEFIINIFKGLS